MTTTLRLVSLSLFTVALAPLAHAQGGPAGPPAVGTTIVQPQSITETNEFVGRIQATDRVDLVARVTGFLTKRLFTEGAEVKTGDLLYQIEKPPFEADVQAKTAAVAQVNANLQNASITLGRATTLLSTPAGQRSTVDDATASQRAQAAQLLAAQANLQTSQINLGYTDIAAPIAGKIGRTNVTIGNVVGPASGTLATIVSQDPMYVVFPIALRSALELRDRYADKGGTSAVIVKLQLPTGKIYQPVGHIDYIDPIVAANTDTVNIRAVIPNPYYPGAKPGTPGDRELADGEFVTVLLQGAQPIQTLAIPQAAVLSDQQGNYVYVVGADNKAIPRRITLGQAAAPLATVTTGLKQGEVIISDGLQRVRPNQPVNPAPSVPGPGGAGGPPGGSALPAPAGGSSTSRQ
ncbi:efflux RND transporter periplasmic adaptor subunit [Acidisphaera sp. L21]|uniref:efflux RND transporter periplasmic adaptor subunit n=1 Tax=Acidisphaera sp. L21 TaxID=1641851 RepID=UPI00131E0132|nr:efflux RND transporter periplasmic adaptor subunit [Acidisphaera sp. L21]